jgi:hypothetical protein
MRDMKHTILATLGSVIVAGAMISAQHVMPAGMSHEEHLKQLQKDAALKQRGATAMGFDQDASVHHFLLQPNGGAIVVSSKDPNDGKLIEQIRSHFRDIAAEFGQGLFDRPVTTHGELPPGAAAMSEGKQQIAYRYVEQPAGASVVIETTDAATRDSIHAFLRYQIVEHKTGDPLTLQ